MPRVTYLAHDGAERELDLAEGLSVMEGAVRHGVAGIDGDCGGACACATCHVYVREEWLERLAPAGEQEMSMLDFAENVRANSRLACQIKVSPTLHGLVVATPQSQH